MKTCNGGPARRGVAGSWPGLSRRRLSSGGEKCFEFLGKSQDRPRVRPRRPRVPGSKPTRLRGLPEGSIRELLVRAQRKLGLNSISENWGRDALIAWFETATRASRLQQLRDGDQCMFRLTRRGGRPSLSESCTVSVVGRNVRGPPQPAPGRNFGAERHCIARDPSADEPQ